MLGLPKKYCIILVVLILLVLLGTTIGVLYGVGVIGLEEQSGGNSGGSSGGNSGGNVGACKVPSPDGDITVENGKSHRVKCDGDLSSAYTVVKCQGGNFIDNAGNQITNGLCGKTCSNLPNIDNAETDSPSSVKHGAIVSYKCGYGYSQAEIEFRCSDSAILQFDTNKNYCGNIGFRYEVIQDQARSYANSLALCKTRGGNLFGSDKKLYTIDGRLNLLQQLNAPTGKWYWMQYNKAADGKTYRRTTDNSIVDPAKPTAPFPTTTFISGYPVPNTGYDYIIVYYQAGHQYHGRLMNHPESSFLTICEIPDGN